MTQPSESFAVDRVLVVLDAGSHGAEALIAAAEMAERLHVDLAALFIEDRDLFRVAALPVSRHFSPFERARTGLDAPALESELKAVASRLEATLSAAAARLGLRSTFRTVRGDLSVEIPAEATARDLIVVVAAACLPGTQMIIQSRLGAIARRTAQSVLLLPPRPSLRHPLAVASGVSDEGHRTLAAAARFALPSGRELDVLALPEDQGGLSELKRWTTESLRRFGLIPRFRHARGGDLSGVVAAAGAIGADLLVLGSTAHVLAEGDGEDILARSGRPVLVVR